MLNAASSSYTGVLSHMCKGRPARNALGCLIALLVSGMAGCATRAADTRSLALDRVLERISCGTNDREWLRERLEGLSGRHLVSITTVSKPAWYVTLRDRYVAEDRIVCDEHRRIKGVVGYARVYDIPAEHAHAMFENLCQLASRQFCYESDEYGGGLLHPRFNYVLLCDDTIMLTVDIGGDSATWHAWNQAAHWSMERQFGEDILDGDSALGCLDKRAFASPATFTHIGYVVFDILCETASEALARQAVSEE